MVTIGLAQKFIRGFGKMLQKNLNELFGQPSNKEMTQFHINKDYVDVPGVILLGISWVQEFCD